MNDLKLNIKNSTLISPDGTMIKHKVELEEGIRRVYEWYKKL